MSSHRKGPDPHNPSTSRTAARGRGRTRVPLTSRVSDRPCCPSASGEHDIFPASSIRSTGSNTQIYSYDPRFCATPPIRNIQHYPAGPPYDPFHGTYFSGHTFNFGGSRVQQFAVHPPRSSIPYNVCNPTVGAVQTYGNVQPHTIDFFRSPPQVMQAVQINSENAHIPSIHFDPSYARGLLQARGALARSRPFAQVYPHSYGDAHTLATHSLENTQSHRVREPHGNTQGCPISYAQVARSKKSEVKNPESSSSKRLQNKGKVVLEEEILEPLGTRCSLCSIDLAFEPFGSHDSKNHPVTAILPCGHCYHVRCLEQIDYPMQTCADPPCFMCTSTL